MRHNLAAMIATFICDRNALLSLGVGEIQDDNTIPIIFYDYELPDDEIQVNLNKDDLEQLVEYLGKRLNQMP